MSPAGQSVSGSLVRSLRKSLEGLAGARGHYLADGVVIAPVLEMRSLPFRVIFFCGLGEGRFPAADGSDPLDLTLVQRRAGDVSPRERDKYLFLETLACARDRLYLSYVNRDAQTGDPLEPSPVVSELLRHLHRGQPGLPADVWVTKQPLQRFDESYFTEKGSRPAPEAVGPNFSLAARMEARARRLRRSSARTVAAFPIRRGMRCGGSSRRLPAGWDSAPSMPRRSAVPNRAAGRFPFEILRRFLECPLQGWARYKLQLPEDQEEDQATREDEPFAMGRLDETALLREVFFDALRRGVHDGSVPLFEELYDQRARGASSTRADAHRSLRRR